MNYSPLVTFCVVTYNHEPYIKLSLESALAQTYSPLEIVISDDQSTDNTVQIINQIISNYKGPHIVRIQQNEKKLGMIENYNKTFSAAKGELIFTAAGDDVFTPDRAEVIVKAWNEHHQKPLLIASSFLNIDGNGQPLGEKILKEGIVNCSLPAFFKLSNPLAFTGPGAVMVYSRKMTDYFGPILEFNAVEDLINVRRARLLGDILVVSQVLVNYRRAGISNQTKTYEKYRKYSKFSYYSFQQTCADLDRVSENMSIDEINELRTIINSSVKEARLKVNMWEDSFLLRALSFLSLSKFGLLLLTHPRRFLGHLIAVASPELGCKIWRAHKR